MRLRCCGYVQSPSWLSTCFDCFRAKAVEVASPNATYELVVKTEMGKGSTIPKGRFNLPRETKPQGKDRILVFAEGRQAEEAKKAGADIVGGLELVEGVRVFRLVDCSVLLTGLIDHQWPLPGHNVLVQSFPHSSDHSSTWSCAWS